MKKILLGNTRMEISQIIYGGIVSSKDGQDNSDKYVDYAIKSGVNYFDVAPTYGDAEEKLGNSLVPHRKNIYLACKTMIREAEPAKVEFEKSLKLLHTDYFDNYQMHSLFNVEDVEKAFSKGGVIEVMDKAKQEGIVKHLGVTCHCEDAAIRALELYDFETVLFPTNWSLYMKKGFGERIAELCKKKNVGLLGMKSMIHRAWLNEEERANSRFTKSWCKPVFDNDELTIAIMKYALQKIGPCALIPPGNIESFQFAVEHNNILQEPITDKEPEMLQKELIAIDNNYFF